MLATRCPPPRHTNATAVRDQVYLPIRLADPTTNVSSSLLTSGVGSEVSSSLPTPDLVTNLVTNQVLLLCISIVPRPCHGARLVHATLQAPPDRLPPRAVAGRPRRSLCGNMVCGMGWQTGWRKLANTLPIGISRVARGRRPTAAPPRHEVSRTRHTSTVHCGWGGGPVATHGISPLRTRGHTRSQRDLAIRRRRRVHTRRP